MKFDIKPSTVLAIAGITLASAFLLTAIVSPASLDWILRADEESSDRIKKEMERQKGIDAGDRPEARPSREDEAKAGGVNPTPSPDETTPASEERDREGERTPKPECVSRDQIINVIGASKEAREGRVIGISAAPDGGRIMVAYRKKTFLGIGSGENQIEGILRRGLRGLFPDRLIKSLKVRSEGKRSVLQGGRNVAVEILSIESAQAGCR